MRRAARQGPRPHRGRGALLALLGAALLGPSAAQAAPTVTETWASQVFSTTARMAARINPGGSSSTYHFDYITRAAYEANVGAAREPFTGAARIPIATDASIGSGSSPVAVTQLASGLSPDTAYRYRAVAKSSTTTTGPTREFITQQSGGGPLLADNRGWEMVSPVQKNGGQVAAPGQIAGGGVLQAAAAGGAVTYGSEASFAGAQGAPPASQYLASRSAGGWSTENLTVPIFSGSFHAAGQGVPYQLFSPDLGRALLLNGDRCRGEGSGCAVANPPLGGTDAPAGYQDYYLRQGSAFSALLGAANAGFLALAPEDFDLRLAGSSPDLAHPVLSTCAALTANATEVTLGEGCDASEQNLYLYSAGQGLSLINLLPGQGTGTPGAALAAQSGAISADGSRVYFTLGGDLYLRAGAVSVQVDADAGGGGEFQTASQDGSVAYFTREGHLWRYLTATGHATDLTPSGGVVGVLGASAEGSVAYFQDASALKRWASGTTTTVATGSEAALPEDWPPTTGAARISADGAELLFGSRQSLSGYDNTDLSTGQPDAELFLYGAAGPTLTCVSCNPTLGRPIGPSSVPGSVPNGTSTNSYKPRALSTSGQRVFFDSTDALALADTNGVSDAYEWEAQGEGSCTRPGGCTSLVSDGHAGGGAAFADASADGSDAFFLTAGSLVKEDGGATDLYDARVGGGFPEAVPPIACEGDACQPLPSAPVDPTLTTLLSGPGNPPVRFPKEGKKGCPKGKQLVKRKGKARCVPKKGKAKQGKGGKR